MNHRTALRFSTDFAIVAFLITTVGAVLWMIDESLDWDILPYWFQSWAEVFVSVLAVLTAFSVVVSFMCSAVVVAEAVDTRMTGGVTVSGKGMSRRTKIVGASLVILVLAGLVGFQQVDKYRAEKAKMAAREKHAQDYFKIQTALRDSIPGIVAKFTPEMCAQMATGIGLDGEAAIAKMMTAIQASTPMAPEVSLMIKASPPYVYQTVLPRQGGWTKLSDGSIVHLGRTPLIDLPSVWERDTVAALFEGAELTVPHGRRGAFIDTREPCAWGLLRQEGKVVGVLMLRTGVDVGRRYWSE